VYIEGAMNAGNVRKRRGLFEDGKTNVPHEERRELLSSTIGTFSSILHAVPTSRTG
jgi:hypothetical protein